MRIKVLGHSTLYIEVGDKKILVDPCLQNEIMGVFRRFPDLGDFDFQLPEPDLIVLTHHHWDVVCIETLLNLPKDVEICIPNNTQLIAILKQMNFVNVQVLEPWQHLDLSSLILKSIPSDVSFGEMGFILSDGSSTFVNLADCKIETSVVNRINKEFPKIDLCFAPFQSYDEMAVLKRENSKLSHKFLIDQARLISQIDSKVILPFKDGLYYPFSNHLNKKSFLYSPFQFIDLLKEFNGEIQSEILLCLDEITLTDRKVDIKRENRFSLRDLNELYNEYRFYCADQAYPEIQYDRSFDLLDLKEIQDFLLEDFYRHLSPKIKKQCRLEGVVFSIDIVDCEVGFQIDFNQLQVELKPYKELSEICLFFITLEDFMDLIYGRQLLSILMQTDRIYVAGINDQMKYRALDIMFGAGFNDSLKVKLYIEYLQSNSIISYGDIIENEYI